MLFSPPEADRFFTRDMMPHVNSVATLVSNGVKSNRVYFKTGGKDL